VDSKHAYDLLKQILDIRLRNPAGIELCRLDISIKECDSHEVGEAVVGILLWTFFFGPNRPPPVKS
jgi:hypothetical protein